MTDPDICSFLLRSVLLRYGHGDLVTSPRPVMGKALEAAGATSGGVLLKIVCDVWSVSFGELARMAGVDQTAVSSYVMGVSSLGHREALAVQAAVERMIAERSAQPLRPGQ